jgi:GSH-dependent disulfide-bond oxidoreductase
MIELHTVPTANGYKVSILLEELGLPYQVRSYDLVKGEHLAADYLARNPVGRLPLIVDRTAGTAEPISVYGTAAILVYLAEKTGRFLPAVQPARARTFEWLGIVSSDIAPAYTGQFVFNVLMKDKLPTAIEHYNALCLRMLGPMEQQLGKTDYLAGREYSIADIIAYPVAAVSMKRFPGDWSSHPNIARWARQVGTRPAVVAGMQVPKTQ